LSEDDFSGGDSEQYQSVEGTSYRHALLAGTSAPASDKRKAYGEYRNRNQVELLMPDLF